MQNVTVEKILPNLIFVVNWSVALVIPIVLQIFKSVLYIFYAYHKKCTWNWASNFFTKYLTFYYSILFWFHMKLYRRFILFCIYYSRVICVAINILIHTLVGVNHIIWARWSFFVLVYMRNIEAWVAIASYNITLFCCYTMLERL